MYLPQFLHCASLTVPNPISSSSQLSALSLIGGFWFCTAEDRIQSRNNAKEVLKH